MKSYTPYLAIFKMRLIAGFQYRAAAWAGVATQFFFGAVFITIYHAFYASSITPGPIPFNHLVSYMWLQQAFLAIIMLWYQDNELLESITSGNIAYELARPFNLFALWYVRLMAGRLSSAAMRCIPILCVAFFLPAPYNMELPPSLLTFGLFVVSMSLALLLSVAISMYIYILTFITMSTSGARLAIGIMAEFLAGSVIPIPMMPEAMQNVLALLPFKYTTDVPLRIYSGNIPTPDALFGIAIQMVWIVGLIGFGVWSLKKVLTRVVIQGG